MIKVVTQDHPHACGDKALFVLRLRQTQGSSPRVWGQVVGVVVAAQKAGIIPTRVGTSDLGYFAALGVGDHPHACGDKSPLTSCCNACSGSSPRVWGQVSFFLSRSIEPGIIPTRVGTRFFDEIQPENNGDHPHACGDK